MEKLQSSYPNFHAIQPYLNYVNAQASKEKAASSNPVTSNNFVLFVGIALIALVVIFLVVLIIFLVRRRKKPQTAIAVQPSLYQSTYNGSGASSAFQPTFNSGSMAPIEQKNNENSSAGTTADGQRMQPTPVQSSPPMPQTPTPVAASNFAQSGPMPSIANRPPLNPQPQVAGSVPAYGQANPYGQQPPRPVQGPPNGAYPGQPSYAPYPQQQYTPNGPYSQNPALPWPPANTPPARPNSPYVPQNPVQQSVPMQGGQQPPANGARYTYVQNPQGYGAAPQPQPSQPVQSFQQSSASISAQRQPVSVPPTPNEPTMRVNPQSTTASEETARSIEDKKRMTSSMSVLPEDQDPTATVLREQEPSTNVSSDNGSEEH